MTEFVPRREVLKVLHVCYKTLYKMADNKEIETLKVGETTLYNLNKYLKDNRLLNCEGVERLNICYCRVSSAKQKEDLKRQIAYMREKYPKHEIYYDVGSGLNFERKSLQKLLKLAIEGKVNEVVVAYKDRLARFGYELIEWIVTEYSKGVITIVNRDEEETPEEELVKDVLQIMNVYVAKINGLRKYRAKMTKAILNNKKSE